MIQKIFRKLRSYNLQPLNTEDRSKKIRSFVILVCTASVLLIMLLFSLFHGSQKTAGITVAVQSDISQSDKLVQYDEMLHKRINYLQQLDGQFASLLNNEVNTISLDSLSTVIHQEEDFCSATIENTALRKGEFTDAVKAIQFEKMIDAFRSVINSRAAINSLRNAVAIKNEEKKDKQTLPDERDKVINNAAGSAKDIDNSDADQSSVPGSVKKNIADLEKKIERLIADNDKLKQVNNHLQKQQNETKSLLKKTKSLQNKIDMLTAEIQLTKVDCNILKMDAVATNYDAKEKKQLLSESSTILSNLSGSENAAIRRKAKDKVILLNHIAGNRN